MKITKQYLQKIIEEEIEAMAERRYPDPAGDMSPGELPLEQRYEIAVKALVKLATYGRDMTDRNDASEALKNLGFGTKGGDDSPSTLARLATVDKGDAMIGGPEYRRHTGQEP